MCTRDISSLFNNVADTVGRTASNTAGVARRAAASGTVPSASAVTSIVDTQVVDSGTAAFRDAVRLFTNDDNWGEAVRIDQGVTPKHFGYGENKETIAEYKVGPQWEVDGGEGPFGIETPDMMHEIAAKARVFGHSDEENHSGSIGAETETGFHSKSAPGRVAGIDVGAQDAFLGVRGRAVAERGCLGARVGEELFIGASYDGRVGDTEIGTPQEWWAGEYSADLGVGEAVVAEIDVLSADVYAGVRAGLDLRVKGRRHDPLISGLGVVSKTDANAFVGAVAEASASVDPRGLSADFDAFAGARAGIQQGFAAAWNGSEVIGGFVEAEAWAGVGVKADACVGYDRNEDRYHLSGDAGAAVGVGGSVGGGVSIAGKDFGKMFDIGDDEEPGEG